jgi:MarR family transcriptional regulator, organic hydroperoxide resistance regulator
MPPLPHPPTVGSLLWHLSLRWRAAVDRAVSPLGLTHAQYSALASLRTLTVAGERPSQRRLAAYTGLGPIYTSKLVRVLERSGMVERQPDPTDARAVLLSLTEHGVDVIDRAVPVVRALNDGLLRPIGGPDSAAAAAFAETLRTLLRAAPEPDPTLEPPTPTPPGGSP